MALNSSVQREDSHSFEPAGFDKRNGRRVRLQSMAVILNITRHVQVALGAAIQGPCLSVHMFPAVVLCRLPLYLAIARQAYGLDELKF